MVVRLDLEQRMGELVTRRIVDCDCARPIGGAVLAARIEAADATSLEDRGVVAVGDDSAAWRLDVRRPDHVEQRRVLCDAVDGPARVENLVPAVFRVGLREHHQLDVGRITSELPEGVDQVVDFVFRQCKSERNIRVRQCSSPAGKHRHRLHGFACEFGEQLRRIGRRVDDTFRHPVVQDGGDPLRGGRIQLLAPENVRASARSCKGCPARSGESL